jgi:hypothetical protein
MPADRGRVISSPTSLDPRITCLATFSLLAANEAHLDLLNELSHASHQLYIPGIQGSAVALVNSLSSRQAKPRQSKAKVKGIY